jgi:hypothetical protein
MALLLCAAFVNNPNTFSQIPRLGANGPAPDRGEKMMLFGQLVGDWEFDYVGYKPDGSKINTKGEWHFGWVLEGRAVQDVWILYAVSDPAKGGTTSYLEYGTTVRFYDPKIDAWKVVWNGAMNGNQRTFIGRKVGDEIVMEGKDSDGSLIKWIFYEIKPQSFHWRDVGSADAGKTWRLQEEMFVRRSQNSTK